MSASLVPAPVPQGWRAPLTDFLEHCRAQGVSLDVIRVRASHLARFAQDNPEPWQVTPDALAGWLRNPRFSRDTRAGAVTALRVFFRWAAGAGRVQVSPAPLAEVVSVGASLPQPWREPVADFLEACRRQGMSAETLRVRAKHLTAFAEAHPQPWAVGPQDVAGWLANPTWRSGTRRSVTTTLRSFYRWATAAGRVQVAPVACPTRPGPAPTRMPAGWAQAVEAFTVDCRAAGHAPETLVMRARYLRRLAEQYSDRSPWSLGTGDLSRFLGNPTWRQSTRKSAKGVLTRFYGWATARGFVQVDPSAALARVRVPRAQPRPAPAEVVSSALLRARRVQDERVHLALLLAVRQGLRRAEVARVHTRDVEQTEDGPALRVSGKGGDVRVLPLHPEVAEALAKVRPGWVFPGRGGGHISPAYLGKLMSRALAGPWTAHTLRHRAGTDWYRAGRDLLAVQRLLGHGRPEITAGYIRVSDAALRACVTEVDR